MSEGRHDTALSAALGERPRVSGKPPVSYRTTLGAASLAAILLWYWPIGRVTLSLNTFVHEFFHAIAAWATGGMVRQIIVHNDASGVTMTAGGNGLLIASAGYVGSAIAGAALLRIAHKEKLVRYVLMGAALGLVIGIALVVRGQALPVGVAVASAVVVFIAARALPTTGVVFFAQFLAVQQCAASFQAFFWLLVAEGPGQAQSDAASMAQMTGVPGVVWASLWSLFGAALIYFALRGAWRDAGRVSRRRKSRRFAEPS